MAQNYELAEQDYMDGMKYKEIAEKYNVTLNTVKSWKTRHKWSKSKSKSVHAKNKKVCTQKRGGQPGNKNAVGGNQSAPPKNKNAEKHGLFSKYLPKETMELVEAVGTLSPLDILWDQITIQYAAIIRAQKIMHVSDRDDKTIEKVGEQSGKIIGEKWEVQHAWDKQANFLQAQARAMTSLNSMIKTYDDMLHRNWDLATEEQKARIENIKAGTAKLKGEGKEPNTKLMEALITVVKGGEGK